MKTLLLEGETVLKEGKANHQRGLETVGGNLYLTNQRLIFESHSFNIQTGVTVIERKNVAGADKAWTTFLGIPLAPNSMEVRTNEATHRFVVSGREEWLRLIQRR